VATQDHDAHLCFLLQPAPVYPRALQALLGGQNQGSLRLQRGPSPIVLSTEIRGACGGVSIIVDV